MTQRKIGRPKLKTSERKSSFTLTMKKEHLKALKKLGEGNASKGLETLLKEFLNKRGEYDKRADD